MTYNYGDKVHATFTDGSSIVGFVNDVEAPYYVAINVNGRIFGCDTRDVKIKLLEAAAPQFIERQAQELGRKHLGKSFKDHPADKVRTIVGITHDLTSVMLEDDEGQRFFYAVTEPINVTEA